MCPAENTPRRVADTSVAGACVCLHPVLSLKGCGVEDRRRQPKSMVQLSVSVCLLVGLLGKRHHSHVCLHVCAVALSAVAGTEMSFFFLYCVPVYFNL